MGTSESKMNLIDDAPDVQATNDLSRVDASKIVVIEFVNGIGQCFPVALPGLQSAAELINFWYGASNLRRRVAAEFLRCALQARYRTRTLSSLSRLRSA